mgnify:CR=1 FL=1
MADMETNIGTMKAVLATFATGYAAVIGGVLDIRTIRHDKQATAQAAFLAKGVLMMPSCLDVSCDCVVRKLAEVLPEIKLVAVSVAVNHG